MKLSENADLKRAAYNTIGAIALQGIRQADLKIGETCAVIGLGLIGQLTCLILRASGVKVVGIDINPGMVEIASKHCVKLAFIREEPGLAEKIGEFTEGIGVDAVIITELCRSDRTKKRSSCGCWCCTNWFRSRSILVQEGAGTANVMLLWAWPL